MLNLETTDLVGSSFEDAICVLPSGMKKANGKDAVRVKENDDGDTESIGFSVGIKFMDGDVIDWLDIYVNSGNADKAAALFIPAIKAGNKAVKLSGRITRTKSGNFENLRVTFTALPVIVDRPESWGEVREQGADVWADA